MKTGLVFLAVLITLPGMGQQTVVSALTLPQSLVDVSTLPKVTGTTRTATSRSNIQTQLNAAVGGEEVVIPASFNCTVRVPSIFPCPTILGAATPGYTQTRSHLYHR